MSTIAVCSLHDYIAPDGEWGFLIVNRLYISDSGSRRLESQWGVRHRTREDRGGWEGRGEKHPELGIFHVISALCETSIPLNAKIRQKLSSFGYYLHQKLEGGAAIRAGAPIRRYTVSLLKIVSDNEYRIQLAWHMGADIWLESAPCRSAWTDWLGAATWWISAPICFTHCILY